MAATFVERLGNDPERSPGRLLSPPIKEEERPHLERLGARLRAARQAARLSRRDVADVTGLNPKTIYRIEFGERRTRPRTLRALAGAISEDHDALAAELIQAAESCLARESAFRERVEARRLRRVRRREVIRARADYVIERSQLEAEWRARSERHLAFRANMRLFDIAFRTLRRMGEL